MRTQNDIRIDLDRATARRAELWRELGRASDPALADELAVLNEEIATLWDELRVTRTRSRFGPTDEIVRRADRDKRLERDIERRIAEAGDARRAA